MNSEAISCTCDTCKGMCKRWPCWGTPQDIQKLIDAGFGDRLMLDVYFSSPGDTLLLCPTTSVGHKKSPRWNEWFPPPMGCTFFTKEGLCALHDLGLKPTEGRLALCEDRTPKGLHQLMKDSWDTSEGRALVAKWREKYFVRLPGEGAVG